MPQYTRSIEVRALGAVIAPWCTPKSFVGRASIPRNPFGVLPGSWRDLSSRGHQTHQTAAVSDVSGHRRRALGAKRSVSDAIFFPRQGIRYHLERCFGSLACEMTEHLRRFTAVLAQEEMKSVSSRGTHEQTLPISRPRPPRRRQASFAAPATLGIRCVVVVEPAKPLRLSIKTLAFRCAQR